MQQMVVPLFKQADINVPNAPFTRTELSARSCTNLILLGGLLLD